jgi:hypothetical protein
MLRTSTKRSMVRMNWLGTIEPSSDPRYWNRKPIGSGTHEQSFQAAGYRRERLRKIFLNSGIDTIALFPNGLAELRKHVIPDGNVCLG